VEYNSQQLINSIPQSIILTDLDNKVVEANKATLDLLGYEESDLVGVNISEISDPDTADADTSALDAVKKGNLADRYIKEFINKRGHSIPVEVSAGPLSDGKKVKGVVYAMKDLSEEMRLLKDLQHRSMQLLASSEVARAATSILDYQELIEKCVDLIREHFGFYYAAVFLIDDAGEWAILKAATGEGGKKLLEIGHKLGVGSQSMVGWVTANNAPRIALDVGEEAIRFDNPYLPKTRAEMALPLRVRGEVIGALDVQSTSVNAFSEDDIQTIQMMADQVAIAIANARLFSERGVV